MPLKHSRHTRKLVQLIGFGIIGNLGITGGLMPGLLLSAQGQAVLLETNPVPTEVPAFEIPASVTPETPPAEVAPPSPDSSVATQPTPFFEPEPSAQISQPEIELEESPQSSPNVETPLDSAPPAPDPYVSEPPDEPPSLEANSMTVPRGCAALLDPSVPLSEACGTEKSDPASNDSPSTPPAAIAESTPAPVESLPTDVVAPARQVQAPVAVNIPPARQVRASTTLLASRPLRSAIATHADYAPLPLPGDIPSPESSGWSGSETPQAPIALGSPDSSATGTNYTVVKPLQYSLKPLTGVNPMKWIFGNQSMLFPLPTPVAVTSAFGWRNHPLQGNWQLHSGIDLGAPQGTPVVAAYDGQVVIADAVGGYGLTVLLNHNNGMRQTRYAHLSKIFVRPGQTISQGDVVGTVGSTGASTGPHLHFETLAWTPKGMVIVDPTQELKLALIHTLEQTQKIAIATHQQSRSSNPVHPTQPDALSYQPIPVVPLDSPDPKQRQTLAPISVDVLKSGPQPQASLPIPHLVE